MSEKYSDPVLDIKFQSMQEHMETRIEQVLEQGARIENQTTKTNGHVAAAFKEIDRLKKISWMQMGGWAVVIIAILPALGLTMYKVWNTKTITQSQIQEASQQGLENALENYQLSK